MPLTVRLDPKTERLIQRLARKRGRSKSELIRDAIDILAKRAQEQEQTERPYETVRDLVGSVRGGPSDLSEQAGNRFRRMLQDRSRRS
ncbi:type II toxin-antitoxin system VapB family antitoxin [Nitrospira sp. BLG_2]|uniref:type II toxin-antitoxin system VapB family antitoxin n=1 Tax=Nitrospira sp. BLG_2 TaxID=3397507 RepID=UPI003B9DA8D8